jgi:macrodomain Ter protein organizer (MatP/YcbG family)
MELFEKYKNLDNKDRVKFDVLYIIFKESEKIKKLKEREDLVKNVNNILDETGGPYFSLDWVKKNIIKI